MKLLIITRKVDKQDERMGFFVDWIEKFAQKIDRVFVISVQPGSGAGFAENIEIFFVSQKTQKHRNTFFKKIKMYFTYKELLNHLIPQVDGVFIHMIPLYANLAGHSVKKYNKKLILWYTHKSVDKVLIKSQKWVDEYVTASRTSFRMKTNRPVNIVGHGINIDKFKKQGLPMTSGANRNKKQKFTILSVGRISPSKDLGTLIKSIHILVTSYKLQVTSYFIGAPALEADKKYLKNLKQLVEKYNLENIIDFLGPKPHNELISYFKKADIFINLSKTGSLDKTVLEAMASGALVLTSNEAFKSVLENLSDQLMFKPRDSHDLAEKIIKVHNLPQDGKEKITRQLQQIVIDNHNLDKTIDKIINLFK